MERETTDAVMYLEENEEEREEKKQEQKVLAEGKSQSFET